MTKDAKTSERVKLNRPWLVAAWPGMGNVALSAGYYLMAKLDMHILAEFSAAGLFDVDHVEVKNGLVRPGHRPRSRFFVWSDPSKKRDLVVFTGEAQPPMGKYALCRKLIEFAQNLGVERIFTFAAMATQMHPQHDSRVFGAATDEENLAELKRLDLEILEDGHIGGLNGVLLGAAAEAGLGGTCLLGEMPHVFAQVPFPKASLAVLKVFAAMTDVELDFKELAEQADAMQQQLGEVLARMEQAFKRTMSHDDEAYYPEPVDEGRLSPEDEQRIETLFREASRDRSKAYVLKQELDRLEVFKDYEDRFLDLFMKSEDE